MLATTHLSAVASSKPLPSIDESTAFATEDDFARQPDTAIVVPPKSTLAFLRQLAVYAFYYLVFKAVATNPITAHLQEYLRAKLVPGRGTIGNTISAFFGHFV